jgi:ABC-type branched-subunit amino acid transport system ATPase component
MTYALRTQALTKSFDGFVANSGVDLRLPRGVRHALIIVQLTRVVRELVWEGGMTIVLVEQHAHLGLSLTRKALVLERGRIVHRSSSDDFCGTVGGNPALLKRLLAVA